MSDFKKIVQFVFENHKKDPKIFIRSYKTIENHGNFTVLNIVFRVLCQFDCTLSLSNIKAFIEEFGWNYCTNPLFWMSLTDNDVHWFNEWRISPTELSIWDMRIATNEVEGFFEEKNLGFLYRSAKSQNKQVFYFLLGHPRFPIPLFMGSTRVKEITPEEFSMMASKEADDHSIYVLREIVSQRPEFLDEFVAKQDINRVCTKYSIMGTMIVHNNHLLMRRILDVPHFNIPLTITSGDFDSFLHTNDNALKEIAASWRYQPTDLLDYVIYKLERNLPVKILRIFIACCGSRFHFYRIQKLFGEKHKNILEESRKNPLAHYNLRKELSIPNVYAVQVFALFIMFKLKYFTVAKSNKILKRFMDILEVLPLEAAMLVCNLYTQGKEKFILNSDLKRCMKNWIFRQEKYRCQDYPQRWL